MQKFLAVAAVLALSGLSPALARGGGHSGGGHMHRAGGLTHVNAALLAPANPSVPPSLTPDPRLIGSAPLPSQRRTTGSSQLSSVNLKPDPADAALDKKIKSICRGC